MDQIDRIQPRADQLHLLPQTGVDTPMGQLLRSFWQPISIAEKLAKGAARDIKVMGEELTLYRGHSGTPYLIGGRCAHRCTVLHTGWIEGDQLRCMYHGWKYDGMGQCVEMPAEKGGHPEQVRIAGYPLHEYAGLIFAYMGKLPAPEFNMPRKDELEAPGMALFPREQVWDCNWFQQIENSLDAVHVSYVHTWGEVSRFQEEITSVVPELSYAETDAGIRQIATRSKNNVRVSDWTFPNNNHVVSPGPKKGDPWLHTVVWAVPIDDVSTMRFTVSAVPSVDPETDKRIGEDRNRDFNPAQHYDELFVKHRIPDAGPGNLIQTQDYVAIRGQGTVFDRSRERLAQSDAGIAILRRIFFRELDAIRAGRPTKSWRKLEHAAELPISVPEAAAE